MHDKFLTKNGKKTGGKAGDCARDGKFIFLKKEESYCIYYGNMVA